MLVFVSIRWCPLCRAADTTVSKCVPIVEWNDCNACRTWRLRAGALGARCESVWCGFHMSYCCRLWKHLRLLCCKKLGSPSSERRGFPIEAVFLYKEKNPFIFDVLTAAYWFKYIFGYRGFRSKPKFERMNLKNQGLEVKMSFIFRLEVINIQKDVS